MGPTPYQLHARTTSLERAKRAEAAQNECSRGTDCSVQCMAAVTHIHVKNESRTKSSKYGLKAPTRPRRTRLQPQSRTDDILAAKRPDVLPAVHPTRYAKLMDWH